MERQHYFRSTLLDILRKTLLNREISGSHKNLIRFKTFGTLNHVDSSIVTYIG